MHHSIAWLALLAVACTPRGASQPAAQSPKTAAVLEVPPPGADASAPPAPAGDGGAPRVAEGVQPQRAPDASVDGGARVSFSGSSHFGTGDAGVTFGGSVTFGSGSSFATPSPALVVHSALLVPSNAPSGHTLILFESQADCTTRQGRHTSVSVDWKRGSKSPFTNLSLIDGHAERYTGHVEVLSAPTAPGSTGAIQLDPVSGGNVSGGKVPVHVCP
jgi:hypothetical protein